MASSTVIILSITTIVLLYMGFEVLRVYQRLAPDKRGLTVRERGVLVGNKILDEPAIHTMSSFELVNSVIPIMLFFEDDLDIELLKKALADSLDDVPLFRARVRFDKTRNLVLLHSQNEGIRYTVQDLAGHNIKDFKGNYTYCRERSTYQVPIFLDRLKLERIFKGTEPLFTVVLTRFENGGTAIGLSVSHLVFDLGTVYQFINIWAERYSTRLQKRESGRHTPNTIFPVTDRAQFLKMCGITSPLPAREILESQLETPLRQGSIGFLSAKYVLSTTWHFIRRFFFTDDRHLVVHYSKEELSLIIQAAKSACKEGEWISSNDGLSAHIWALVTRLQEETNSSRIKKNNSIRNFCMVINARPRFEPPLAPEFLGNIVLSVSTQETRKRLLETTNAAQLSQLALKLRNSMNQVTSSYCNALIQWMQLLSPNPVEKMPLSPRGYFTFIPCNDSYFMLTNCASNEMDFYELKFGGAKLQWIQVQALYGCAMIGKSPDDPDGLDLHLSLPPSMTPSKADAIKTELIKQYDQSLTN